MSSLRLLSHSVLAASALMGVAPPALAADAVNPAASAPIAAGDTLLPATVLRDNLWTLAARVQHDPGITRQQVMVAMLRRNPNAFLQGNMHRLRRDVALVVPTAQEIAAENAGAAEAVVAALGRLEGVEVAAVSPEGKIIATIEADGDRETVEIYEAMSVLDRVLSVSMVYHQKEDEPDLELAVAA